MECCIRSSAPSRRFARSVRNKSLDGETKSMPATTLSNEEILEAIGNKTVVELAELIEAFKSKFNVTIAAAAPAAGGGAAGGGAAAAPAAEEKTEWAVILKEGGAKKIQVIKVVRE